MDNFSIIKLSDDNYPLLVVMETYEAPFQYLYDIENALLQMNYSGIVLLDQLLHSGNNDERFILANFDGKAFDRYSFKFINIERRSNIRRIACEALKKDKDIIEYSILNNSQKLLLGRGLFI